MIKNTIRRLTRYGFIFCLVLVVSFTVHAQETSGSTKRPKVALVLSGGGAKGFAHIGVLKVLEEEGIPIDLIVGTSMGSLVGGIYALGYNASELEDLVKSLDWETVLTDDVSRVFLSRNDQLLKQRYILSLPITGEKKLSLPQGFIKGQNVLNIFCGLAGNLPENADFEKLPIPFACVAADLETGKEVVLKNGFLPTAMFSSMAIPVAFQSSDRDGLFLVDGGIVNNFPTDVAKRMGADIIIGVDIRNDFYDRNNLKTISNVLEQLVSFFDSGKDSVNKNLCDLIIRPDVAGYSMTSFNNEAVDTLISRGEKATNNLREQIREMKLNYQLEPQKKSRELVKPEKWHITDFSISGSNQLDRNFILNTIDLEIPGDFSSDEIKVAIDRLYGLGGFDRIYYSLIDTGEGKTLNFNIATKKVFTQNIGFRANTTDAAAILINTTRKDYKNLFGLLSVSAELSVNPGISLVAESNKSHLPTLGISVEGKYQNYNVFEEGKKIIKANIFYTSATMYLYQPFLKQYIFGLGLQEEYYGGDIFGKFDSISTIADGMNHFTTNAFAHLSFDNMDNFYFPSKGTNMYAEFSMLADFSNSSKISPVLLYKMRNVIPVWQKTVLLLDVYGRALFNSNFPQAKMTLVGGELYSQYFNYHLPFVGLSAVNIADRFAYIGLVGLRVQISESQYLSVLLNGLRQSNEVKPWEKASMIYGGGIRYSLKTIMGPLDMTLGYSGSTDKPSFSANFGYWF